MPETAAPTTPAPAPAPSAPAAPISTEAAIESFPRTFGPRPLPDDMLSRIRAKAKPTGTIPYEGKEPAKPAEPAAAKEPEEETEGEDHTEVTDETQEESSASSKPSSEESAAPEKVSKKKQSPWRVADHWKAKAADLERQLAESRKGAIPESQAKDYTERVAKAEARVQELEKEIQFVNYEKSHEFQEKYHEPYAQAFRRAVAELSEVHVTDSQGNSRPAGAEDILGLVSLPLGKAREVADAMFGAFADDAMAHRKEIKSLFDQRQTALEKAKTEGVERAKQQQLQATEAAQKIGQAVTEIWNKANQEATVDKEIQRYFTPIDSDPEWNARLKKGYEMADKAFSDPNPRDPRLTQEQREEIIKRHAAMRNRSAAFGALRYRVEQLEAALKEKEAQLSEYKQSEPGQGAPSRSKPGQPVENGYTLSTLGERLRKYAK